MPTINIASRFRSLNPGARQYIATVIDHRSDGTSLVESDNGTRAIVTGQSVAESSRAIIRGSEMIGPAASLPTVDVELF